jgi:hypothetical protein
MECAGRQLRHPTRDTVRCNLGSLQHSSDDRTQSSLAGYQARAPPALGWPSLDVPQCHIAVGRSEPARVASRCPLPSMNPMATRTTDARRAGRRRGPDPTTYYY